MGGAEARAVTKRSDVLPALESSDTSGVVRAAVGALATVDDELEEGLPRRAECMRSASELVPSYVLRWSFFLATLLIPEPPRLPMANEADFTINALEVRWSCYAVTNSEEGEGTRKQRV